MTEKRKINANIEQPSRTGETPLLKKLLLAISSGLFLIGCQSKMEAEKPPADPVAQSSATDQQWHPSTLSDQTIATANAAVLDYRTCLASETKAKARDRGDPRVIANTILKSCEPRLSAIKTAFAAEHVPDSISERYQRKTRSQGAQSVLRAVMGIHAERAGEEAEAAAHQPKQH
jgi:hypothetical protein